MKHVSKKLGLIFSIFFMMSVFAFSKAEFKAGKYLGTADGFGGEIQVEVTVSSDKIEKVEIVKHSESAGISDFAITSIPAEIVEYQSIEVDGAAGATVSSDAIKLAVKNALSHSGVDMAEITKKVEKKIERDLVFDKEADVVIIGAGGAGLAAGVSAYEHGSKSVIILEKMPAIGGNTMRSGGAMNAVNPPKQKAQGIEDSVELHFTHTYEGGDKKGNPELVRVMVENATDAVNWLEKIGVKWRKEIGSVIGSLWMRGNKVEGAIGIEFMTALEGTFTKQGGKIYLNVKAESLIKKDGRVVGVTATDKNGNTLEFIARKGVIVASGGYGANAKMAKEYLGEGTYTSDMFPDNINTTNHPGATGDGIAIAKEAGVALTSMEHIQMLPLSRINTVFPMQTENAIFVNKQGNRFVREDGRRDEISMAALVQEDSEFFIIYDQNMYPEDGKTTSGDNILELIERGLMKKSNDVEELAKNLDVPYENLKKSIDNFNEHADKKETDEFGRTRWFNRVDKAPYYTIVQTPALHHTMGGIKIDTGARALDLNDKPIPGLYAAGEVTGGIHGANRLGGNAITDIIVFGRIAGENAVKENKDK